MFTLSQTTQPPRTSSPNRRERRGVALVFVLVFVIAMAALAMGSIFMASNANLLAKSYDRERDLKFAAEAALAIGKSRVNADPTILMMRRAEQVDTAILRGQTLTGADGLPLSGIEISIYVGPSGSTSGQFGRFSSIVAEARDKRGNGFIRRLELTQESFAKFAYWSNRENDGSGTIFFNNRDELWGPVWSNDTISIGGLGAIFHDEVGTTTSIVGAQYGTFIKGKKENQKPIPLPSTSQLAVLSTIANSSGWRFTSGRPVSNDENSVLDRIEFIAADLNAAGDSTALNDGLFRIFTATSDAVLRGDFPADPTAANVNFCGDWHWTVEGDPQRLALRFYPASVHDSPWFRTTDSLGLKARNPGMTDQQAADWADVERGGDLNAILSGPGARCYLPGDPHLAAVERTGASLDPATGLPWAAASREKGGMDTTFTPSGAYGSWRLATDSPNAVITASRMRDSAKIGDQKYLFPIDRLYNASAKGVIYFTGNVGVSGTLNGRITLYANGTVVLVDDLRYANDPVKGVCRDILGIISDRDVVIADNAINTPQTIGPGLTKNLDDTKDEYIHAVIMALGTSFRVQNYGAGPVDVNGCDPVSNGRGCIYLSGGVIQQVRGPVGTSGGTGFAKRYSYDRCAVVNPPPYFPTTGRFQDNRYLELDPVKFNDVRYFRSIAPTP